ncbi:MAG: ABC transporter ATP-binding protein [Desulfurella sp.]|jgi:putative ABC transport system ATP-binding protein|uniref:ABC transporter ATP-binding protein n=1 Tax=Desulfurella sp. TaxID=1962857 RepID=UPI003C7863CC
MKAILEAKNIVKYFGVDESKTYALKGVNLTAYYGEVLYIVGPSGSGKTTLLSIISGILRPNEGTVIVKDKDIWKMKDDDLADFRLNHIGFVFQDYHLFPKLTTTENVSIPLFLKRQNWDKSLKEAKYYLDVMGLGSKADLPVYKLSGGEQQRVAIARAIVSKPDILIFDEPTASLDGETGRQIISFVKEHLLTQDRTIIIVTHDSRIFEYANRILHMEDGKLKQTTNNHFDTEKNNTSVTQLEAQ